MKMTTMSEDNEWQKKSKKMMLQMSTDPETEGEESEEEVDWRRTAEA